MTHYFLSDTVELESAVESTTTAGEGFESPWSKQVSAILPDDFEPPLASETGILPMIQLAHEHRDHTEGEDADYHQDEIQPAPKAARSKKDNHVPKVLIVEDTIELAEVIQVTLERANLVTYHEMHADRVMALIIEQHPDLVLLDLGLPDTSGWKILDAMREHYAEVQMEMPIVIIITAYGDPANRLVGKLQNIHSYVLKPFTSDEIEQVVVNALNGAS